MKVVEWMKLYINIKKHKLYECDKKECHNFTSENVCFMMHIVLIYI